MGLVTLTRAPTSTPSWISLPGPKARTVRERARAAGAVAAAVERRGVEEEEVGQATHRLDAAEAVACIFCFSRADSFSREESEA